MHMRIVGLCVIAVAAISAVTVSGASAAAPEFGRCLKIAKGAEKKLDYFDSAKCIKTAGEDAGTEAEKLKKGNYQWFSGVVKTKFTTKIKEGTLTTLETVGGTKITCTGQKSKGGEYLNAKETGKEIVEFSGCETSGLKCESAGAGVGNITTAPLRGPIGFETEVIPPTKNHIAKELHSEPGGNLTAFSCAGLPVVVKGSMLHKIAANAMKLTATEKFTASKGKQKPEHFAGGVPKEHILETSTNGGPFEQSGQTLTTILTNEEKVEASTIL